MASPARMPRPLSGPAVVAPGRPGRVRRRARRQRVRDRHDPKRIRYGCFLPDLTGLATAPPTPAPRGGYIRSRAASDKGQCGRFQGLENTMRSRRLAGRREVGPPMCGARGLLGAPVELRALTAGVMASGIAVERALMHPARAGAGRGPALGHACGALEARW